MRWFLVLLPLLLLGCSKPLLVSAGSRSTREGNGESFAGTDQLQNTARAISSSLVRSALDVVVRGAADSNHCLCGTNEPACLALKATFSRDACVAFTLKAAPLLIKLLSEARPSIVFTEDSIEAPINASGDTGQVSARTAPGEAIEVDAKRLRESSGKLEDNLAQILAHEFTHHLNIAATGRPAQYVQDFSPTEPIDDFANYLVTNLRRMEREPLSCSIRLDSAAPSIKLDQLGRPMARSSAVSLTILSNRAVTVKSLGMDRGDFSYANVSKPGGLGMRGTFSVNGIQTMTVTVTEQSTQTDVSCELRLRVVGYHIAMTQIHQMFKPSTQDRMATPSTTEGGDNGYAYNQPLFKVYVEPSPVCSRRLYRVNFWNGTHAATNGTGGQMFLGYGCDSNIPGTLAVRQLYNTPNGVWAVTSSVADINAFSATPGWTWPAENHLGFFPQ